MTAPLAISTVNLTKQFEGHIAVNNVDLAVQAGEIYGLIGPNGAGKTTLIRMLAAAEEPTAGEIYIGGARFVQGQSNPEVKRQLGFLPDDFPLYDDLMVWQYLDYFARLYYLTEPNLSERLSEVLALVNLEEKRHSLVGTLSRGMKQRLSLSRTIIHRPTLLLLDEPVSGLDPIARIEFREIIKGLRQQGMSILISSHILSDLAEFCTSIGIMELGHLVESAPLQELYDRLSGQKILISALADVDTLQAELRNHSLVGDCEVIPDKGKVQITFSGTPEESALLLRSLIESGLLITEFCQVQESLEGIFLKLGHKQTS